MRLPYSNLRISHQNPGATKPLVLPIHVICNTSDDDLYSNIRANSRRPGAWQQLIPAHGSVAVLCGSGPSLGDFVEEIRAKQAGGAKVFAMNGAAAFLDTKGITPDYQVIIDAREETAQLVGPARNHLFASQVHPSCFNSAPYAKVWHLQIGGIDDHLPPDYGMDYCLIGGAASVGNTATCLAFAMGYRDLQIYGYDSSHRGEASHAFHQVMNDGEPCASVLFGGKDYICSLTMKLQAEKFQSTAQSLIDSGCAIEVHGDGLLPDMFRAPVEVLAEHEKYERMWQFPDYREIAPGEDVANLFLSVVNVIPTDVIVDFGCGTGRGAKRIHEATGCEFILVDFTSNSLDESVKGGSWYTFMRSDLAVPLPMSASGELGYCTDVMEHIPPEQVDQVIQNIMACSKNVFFQVSTIDDECGVLIGQHLHLSVHPMQWWLDTFSDLGHTVEWFQEDSISFCALVKRGPTPSGKSLTT